MSFDSLPESVRERVARHVAQVLPARQALDNLTPDHYEFARRLIQAGAYGPEWLDGRRAKVEPFRVGRESDEQPEEPC